MVQIILKFQSIQDQDRSIEMPSFIVLFRRSQVGHENVHFCGDTDELILEFALKI